MNSNKLYLVLILIAVAYSFSINELNAQTMLIKPDSLFLGKIPLPSNSTRIVEIKNTSSTALNISKIELLEDSGSNFTIIDNPGSVSLNQLQKIYLNIQYNPTASDTNRAIIRITSNASTSPDNIGLFGVGSSDDPITFERRFGDEDAKQGDGLNSAKQTPDGGYICAGNTNPDEDYNNVLIAKTDKYGKVEWFKSLGDDDETEEANTVEIADNGNYVVFGRTNSEGEGGFDYWLMEVNSEGEIVWDKTYGGNKDEMASSMVKTPDGGYILVGSTRSFGDALSTDVYIVKVSSNGSEEWTKTYGGTGGESPSQIIKTSDNNYLIVGNTASFGGGSFDAYMLKINGNGEKIWEKTFGGADIDEANYVTELNNGNFVIAGYTVSHGAGAKDILILKLDSDGNQLQFETLGFERQDRATGLTSNGENIILAGTIEEQKDSVRFNMFVLNKNMEILRSIKITKGMVSFSVGEMWFNVDGNLVIAGSSGTFSFSTDAYLRSTSMFSDITPVEEETDTQIIDQFELFPNYPNPFNNQTQITFNLNKPEYIDLSIYNVVGQKVETLIQSFHNAGYYKIGFNGHGLTSGIYFIRLTTKTNSQVQSMLLLK